MVDVCRAVGVGRFGCALKLSTAAMFEPLAYLLQMMRVCRGRSNPGDE